MEKTKPPYTVKQLDEVKDRVTARPLNAPDTCKLVQQIDTEGGDPRLMRPLFVSVPMGTPVPKHLEHLRKLTSEDRPEHRLMPQDPM